MTPSTSPEVDSALPQRFWEKVEVTDGCWFWKAYKQVLGYGQFRWEGRTQLAHRVAWTSVNGPIPDGLELDHLCREPSCVNPDHLEAVTHRENNMRGILTNGNVGKTHCRRGHPLSGNNLYVWVSKQNGSRHRHCQECNRIRKRQMRKRRREALRIAEEQGYGTIEVTRT